MVVKHNCFVNTT